MKRVKGSGISKKLPPMYPEEYPWRDRNSREEATVFIDILSHIAGIYLERYKQPGPTIFVNFFTLIYSENYTNLSIFLIDFIVYGAPVLHCNSIFLIVR